MPSPATRPRVLGRRMPIAGTSALVGAVTLVSLTLVVLTALQPAAARPTNPPTAGSGGSPSPIALLHPQAMAPTTTAPIAVVVTTPVPTPTTTAAPAATPPSTRPPATPHPTTVAKPVASHPILPPGNPSANIAETPDFTSICRSDGTESAACIAVASQATDAARVQEGLGAVVLPSNYSALSPGQQLFVLINVERVDRGLPPVVGMVAELDTDAQNAAAANTDPTPVSVPSGSTVMAWASNWAEAAGPLGSNYDWMYADGPGSGNLNCNAGDPGSCWGHRDNELGFNETGIAASHGVLVMGAAEATVASDSPWTSDAALMALVTGSPTYTYTWAQAEAAGAR